MYEMYPSYWCIEDVGFLSSWFREILERVYQRYTSRSWQASKVNKATAMAEDIDRPEEKPRPPAGGQSSFPIQARISSDTGGFKVR